MDIQYEAANDPEIKEDPMDVNDTAEIHDTAINEVEDEDTEPTDHQKMLSRIEALECSIRIQSDMVKETYIRIDNVEKLLEGLQYTMDKIEKFVTQDTVGSNHCTQAPSVVAGDTTETLHRPNNIRDSPHILERLRDPKTARRSTRVNASVTKTDVSTIILDVSDDDNMSDHTNEEKVETMHAPVKELFSHGRASTSKLASQKQSKLKTKDTLVEVNQCTPDSSRSNHAKSTKAGKRVSFTPSLSSRHAKVPKKEQGVKLTPRKNTGFRINMGNQNKDKGKKPMYTHDTEKTKKRKNKEVDELEVSRNIYANTRGFTMPPYIECKFRVTIDMELDPFQITLCAYIWHPKTDPKEVIFKVGDTIGTRKDFDSLCPGRTIPEQLIKWMALRATAIQKRVTQQTIWSLPPSFARDALQGTSLEELVDMYAKEWMQPYSGLRYIYTPVQEVGSGHWFLGVISIEDQIVYHFDSHCDEKSIEPRRETLHNLCEVISRIVATDVYPPNYLNNVFDQDNWEFAEPRGIGDCGHSKNSAVWVMKWQDMEHCFTVNHAGVFRERAVRMNLALALLKGSHNQCWSDVLANAEAFWNTIKIPAAT